MCNELEKQVLILKSIVQTKNIKGINKQYLLTCPYKTNKFFFTQDEMSEHKFLKMLSCCKKSNNYLNLINLFVA